MLDKLTAEAFAEHLEDVFRVRLDASSSLDLRLVEVTVIGSASARQWAAGGHRAPFSIIFRGRKDFVLPQQIVRLEHDEMGGIDLFLVPIGPDAEGMRYEAIFT